MPREQYDRTQHTHEHFQPEVKNVIRLTLEFTKAVSKHQKDKTDNLIVSPYNALTCLAMVAKGAAAETKEEMAQSLFGISADRLDFEVARLAALNAGILDSNKGQVEIMTANGVWVNNKSLKLDPAYADELKKIFSAEISGEDFSNKATVDKINKWADEKTKGLIKKVIDDLGADDFAVLASSLYFKGQWTKKFDKAQTEDRAFIQDSGNIVHTPTMQKYFSKKGDVSYKDGADYEAVCLTYGEEDSKNKKTPSMNMLLLRPKDNSVSARQWLEKQAGGKSEWMDFHSFERVIGTVDLPRLDIKQHHDIIPALRETGIRKAFSAGQADFSPMNVERLKELFIGKVSHDVVFKTDEEGSEGAAVTTVSMKRSLSLQTPPKRVDIKFDRSFVFVVQDRTTGAPLFIGAVNAPNKDMKQIKKSPKP